MFIREGLYRKNIGTLIWVTFVANKKVSSFISLKYSISLSITKKQSGKIIYLMKVSKFYQLLRIHNTSDKFFRMFMNMKEKEWYTNIVWIASS